MAKPVSQITTRGSAATARTFQVMPVAGSPHRRPRSLSLRGQGELLLNFVRSRNKVVRSLIARLACTLQGGRRTCVLRPYLIDSKGNLWISLTNSSRRKAPARERVPRCWDGLGLRALPFRKVVTWLILPVVICLSQRLSHACLSINKFVL